MMICPNRRTKLGLGWSKGSCTRCRVPEGISNHGKGKGTWLKGERELGKEESEIILCKTGLVVQVGSGRLSFFIKCTLWFHIVMLACVASGFVLFGQTSSEAAGGMGKRQ